MTAGSKHTCRVVLLGCPSGHGGKHQRYEDIGSAWPWCHMGFHMFPSFTSASAEVETRIYSSLCPKRFTGLRFATHMVKLLGIHKRNFPNKINPNGECCSYPHKPGSKLANAHKACFHVSHPKRIIPNKSWYSVGQLLANTGGHRDFQWLSTGLNKYAVAQNNLMYT